MLHMDETTAVSAVISWANKSKLLIIGIGITMLVVVGGYLVYPAFSNIFAPVDSTVFQFVKKGTPHTADALLLVSTEENPDVPFLVAADFVKRTLTPLADLRNQGAAITSGHLTSDGQRLVYTTFSLLNSSSIVFADGNGVISSKQADIESSNARRGFDWDITGTIGGFSLQASSSPKDAPFIDRIATGNPDGWYAYVYSTLANISSLLGKGFAPTFSPASEEVVYLSPYGVVSASADNTDQSTRNIVLQYPDGQIPSDLLFSDNKSIAVLTYRDNPVAYVYAVSWNPASFTLLKSFAPPNMSPPFQGSGSIAVKSDDAGSVLSMLAAVTASSTSLILEETMLDKPDQPIFSLKLPTTVLHAGVVQWLSPVTSVSKLQ